MKDGKKVPKRLYKYRDLSNRTIEMIVSDQVYFANPNAFNDPLDTRPSLKTDLDKAELEKILWTFIEQRTSAEFFAAAKKINISDPEILDQIEMDSYRQVAENLAEIDFDAEGTEDDAEDQQCSRLGYYIEMELLQ
jgi:hypothetical protein